MNLMNERNVEMSDGCSITSNAIRNDETVCDEISTQIATMTNQQSSHAIKSANIDPIAVLKRVENLRKWQEEEQKKLLKAHEEYMRKIQTEQEMYSKLINNNTTSTIDATLQSNKSNQSSSTMSSVSTTQTFDLNNKISHLTKDFKQKRMNMIYSAYDDDDDDENDNENETQSVKEMPTQQANTRPVLNEQEVGHNNNNNNDNDEEEDVMKEQKLDDNDDDDDQEERREEISNSSASNEDLDDDAIDQMSESELIELIKKQLSKKNFNFQVFNEHDVDTELSMQLRTHQSDQELVTDPNGQTEKEDDEEFYNSNHFNFNMNQLSDIYNENEEFMRNHRLSTIIEVSSEENSPLKAMHRNTNRKGNKRVNLSKRISTVNEENETQVETEMDEQKEDIKRNKEEENVKEKATHTTNKMVNLDELPIGVKQTNQMSFEQLIEEKLKIADQLDQEQLELSKLAKSKKNKQQSEQQVDQAVHSSTSTTTTTSTSNFLKKNSSKVALNMKQAPKQPVPKETPVVHVAQIEPEVVVECAHDVETQPSVSRAPCKYLKKGEGLKRYQPRAKSTEPIKLQQQSSMTNMKSSSNQRITSSSSSTLRKSNSTSSLLNNNNNKKATLNAKSGSNNAKRVATANNANQAIQSSSSSTQKSVLRKDSSTDRLSSVSLPSTSSSSSVKANNSSISNNQRADKLKEDVLIKQQQRELEQQQRRIEMLILQQHQEQQRNSMIRAANKFELSDEAESELANVEHEQENEIEDDELKEFETLEQYVDEHPSFRSSVSFVENVLLTNSANSQQQQQQQHRLNGNKLSDLIEEEDVCNYGRSHTAQTRSSSTSSLTRCESASSIKSNSQQQGVVVRKVKRLSETSRRVSSSSPFDYDDTKHHTDTQMFDQAAHFYSNRQHEPANNNNNNNNDHDGDDDERNERLEEANFGRQQVKQANHFDDSTSWNDEQPMKATVSHRLLKHDLDEEGNNKHHDDDDDSDDDDEQEQKANRTTVTNLMNKLFPSLKEDTSTRKSAVANTTSQSDESMPNRAQPTKYEPYTTSQQPKQQQQPIDTSQESTSNILKQKLAQLESEIDKFQKKNGELSKLKEKCEVELKLAESTRAKMEKEKQEEMARLREMHDEEMRKLKLEKKVFEQYKQSLKEQQPDRRERDEIDRLRKQVQELSDELKLKETRWMANNARLKERIDTLEQEKQELKKELQLIEKQRIESLMSVNTHNQHQHHQTQQSQGQQAKAPLSSSSSCSSSSSASASSTSGLNVYQQLRSNQQQLEAQRLSEESTMMTTQHANNLMLLKRSISEKSLSSSSASSTCSSSSSASIASTGSLALHSNLKYPHHQQQQQQPHQMSVQSTQLASNTCQTVKSVKFKLDNQQMPISSASADYDEHDSMLSSGVSNNRVSNADQSHHHHNLQSNEYVNVQGSDRPLRVKETRHYDDKHVEKLLEDGTTLTIFPNGTVKQISADKRLTFVKFFNGDRKEMNHDTGTETYFYAETNITQIIYSNGLQILKFPNGQIEKHHTNKTREIIFPDKVCKFIYPDGSEESRLPNGTYIKVDPNGDKVIEYANKQREIHTKEYKRREYPDGSIKTVYSNGLSETRYASGRVRIKDSQGNIISDKKF